MRRRYLSRSVSRILPISISRGSSGALILIFISCLTLITSVINPSTFSGVRTSAADLFHPVLNTVVKPVQDTAAFVRNITGLAELQSENIRLQKENARLREWYQTALVLEAENKSLRNLMNVKLEPQNKYISARILADFGQAFVKSLLVSAGTEQGVREGQSVLSGEGLVGRIVDAGEKTSRILLVTDINSRIPVLLENTSQHAILAGTNNALPRLEHLPPDNEVSKGARIITSGYGGMLPYGLPVGRIVIDKSGAPRVKLFADMDRLVFVRIVDKGDDPNLKRANDDNALIKY